MESLPLERKGETERDKRERKYFTGDRKIKRDLERAEFDRLRQTKIGIEERPLSFSLG